MDDIRNYLQALLSHNDSIEFISQTMLRLVLAALLGGIIGLEREMKRKPAGLRTNMFICFGSAMFTILSQRLALHYGGDPMRIAAQIIPGIGFIGAGAILHARHSVSGVTTAATIFVVASIGMAAGAALYLAAIFATIVILIGLMTLGWVEARFDLKTTSMTYEVQGDEISTLMHTVSRTLSERNHSMQAMEFATTGNGGHLMFTVHASHREHQGIVERLRQADGIKSVNVFGEQERE